MGISRDHVGAIRARGSSEWTMNGEALAVGIVLFESHYRRRQCGSFSDDQFHGFKLSVCSWYASIREGAHTLNPYPKPHNYQSFLIGGWKASA